MLTVGQLNEKISMLRSKIAVTEGLVLYLQTHYMPSDGSTAEMHYTRSDYGKVPPAHIEATIADYVDYLDSLKIELDRLENTPLAMPEVVKLAPAQEVLPEKPAPVAKTKNGPHPAPTPSAAQVAASKAPPARKEPPSGTARGSQDQPAPAQPAPSRQAG
jgi:hypothetical protein